LASDAGDTIHVLSLFTDVSITSHPVDRIEVIVLRSRRAARSYLASVTAAQPAGGGKRE
jgi:hypothetical protein